MTLSSPRDQRDGHARVAPTRFLGVLVLVVVLVRATYVPRPLRNDEGGYLLVARQWHAGGEFLYGDYFVDRPPLLMLIFRVAALIDWDQAIRVVAIPFALVFVLAGQRAGTLLGGPPAGRWAAVVAAGVMCSPGLAADQADGELFGAALVMAAIALAVSAWHADAPGTRRAWALAAGGVAAAAPLVKQNLLEGVLFLAVLVVCAWWTGDAGARRRALELLAPAGLGVLAVGALVWLWLTSSGTEPMTAWRDLMSFRGAALDAIWSSDPDATLRRGAQLAVLGLVTGLLPVVLVWLTTARRTPAHDSPEGRATTALVVFGLVAIAAGGSFWPPYLLQLAPAAVLAAAMTAPAATVAGAWMRRCGGTVVAAAALGTVVAVVVHVSVPATWYSQRIGEWLAESKAPSDTGLVVYGLPSVLETADMPSPYPYVWSLPMRTADPDQVRLRATLAGPGAPAWIVQVIGLDAWGIDEGSQLRDLVRHRYRVVATICGHPVWLRQDLTRRLSAPPPC